MPRKGGSCHGNQTARRSVGLSFTASWQETQKVIRSQSVNCKLMPTGSGWPAAQPPCFVLGFTPSNLTLPFPETPWRANTHTHCKRVDTLEHPSAHKTHHNQTASLISLSHLPPQRRKSRYAELDFEVILDSLIPTQIFFFPFLRLIPNSWCVS